MRPRGGAVDFGWRGAPFQGIRLLRYGLQEAVGETRIGHAIGIEDRVQAGREVGVEARESCRETEETQVQRQVNLAVAWTGAAMALRRYGRSALVLTIVIGAAVMAAV